MDHGLVLLFFLLAILFLPALLTINLKFLYWILASFTTFILLPYCLLFGAVFSPLALLLLITLPYAFYKVGKKASLPDEFLSRYGPFIAPIFYFLMYERIKLTGTSSADMPTASIVIYLLFMVACFAAGTWRSNRFKTTLSRKALYALAISLIFVSLIAAQNHA